MTTTNGSVQPHTNYGVTHTDRCRVSPIGGCAWKCKFCDLPYEFTYRKKHEHNLLEVILAARTTRWLPARHVLISGGTPRAPRAASGNRPADRRRGVDRWRLRLPRRALAAARRRDDAAAQGPRPSRAAAGRMGINMLSVNLEVSDPSAASATRPGRRRRSDATHTLAYIERAVEAFGVGFVQSLDRLRCGDRAGREHAARRAGSRRPRLRSRSSARSARIISRHSPTRHRRLRRDGRRLRADAGDLRARRHGVRPGPRCIPCHHNTATIPDGATFYLGLEG